MKHLKEKTTILFLLVFLCFLKRDAIAIQEPLEQIPLRPTVEYKAEGSRDPFQPLDKKKKIIEPAVVQQLAPKVPLPALNISAIVWGGIFPQAIINGKVVKPGDSIEGVNIVDINKTGITVSFANRIYNLPSPGTGK